MNCNRCGADIDESNGKQCDDCGALFCSNCIDVTADVPTCTDCEEYQAKEG
jgi:hypothetical protein